MIDLTKNILYEDVDLVVINKPAGLVVHPDGRTKEESVSMWFADTYPGSREVGEKLGDIDRPGVVHRIDRETSGILVLVKTRESHAALKAQFQSRTVEKIYHLFVYGSVKVDEGSINLPIGRSVSDFKKRATGRAARGELREAITHFKVLKRSRDKTLTFVEARPKTGRTHQIRVHFKDIHHPVIADKLYAPKKPLLLGFKRLALHARAIHFKNLKGEKVAIEAPYPEDFERAIGLIDKI